MTDKFANGRPSIWDAWENELPEPEYQYVSSVSRESFLIRNDPDSLIARQRFIDEYLSDPILLLGKIDESFANSSRLDLTGDYYFAPEPERTSSKEKFPPDLKLAAAIENTELNQRVLEAAKRSVGHAMWGNFASVVQNGWLGCAASVSAVLKLANVNLINTPRVFEAEQKLLSSGATRLPLSEAQPGDVIVFEDKTRGSRYLSHIGIVGESGKLYHNDSYKRKWVEADIRSEIARNHTGAHILRLRQNA